jgi:ornithine decarboxylase
LVVIDHAVIRRNYAAFRKHFPKVQAYYAVKANPAPQILDRLVGLGSRFDAAGIEEIEACLAAGALPQAISFGNTVKKESAIRAAFASSVNGFSQKTCLPAAAACTT